MAATTLIAVDMGGYQLADALAQTRESWVMAMYTGYMAGATIVSVSYTHLKIIRPDFLIQFSRIILFPPMYIRHSAWL